MNLYVKTTKYRLTKGSIYNTQPQNNYKTIHFKKNLANTIEFLTKI